MSEDQNYGYILRLSTEDWRDQVYELKKYYSGVMRGWKRETPILLAMKTDAGDPPHGGPGGRPPRCSRGIPGKGRKRLTVTQDQIVLGKMV